MVRCYYIVLLLATGAAMWGCGKSEKESSAPVLLTPASAETSTKPEQGNPKVTYAIDRGSTPGQLTIIGKDGKPGGVCPLKHTNVAAEITGYVARVEVTQEFHNPTDQPIEAVYTFPLPEDAAVDDMTMRVGDRTITSQILRREEAREVYEAAKIEVKATALLDQERPNIFTQAVANILPGSQVKIIISYVNLLKYQEGQYEFVFPMVVGPRYTPGGGYREPGKRGEPSPQKQIPDDPGSTSVVTDADKITPPITPPGTRAGHDISLSIAIEAGLPIQKIESPLHTAVLERKGASHAIVRLKDQNEIPNRDFILRYTAAGSEIQSGVLTYAPDASGGYFTLIIQPPLAPTPAEISPKEMVFVIDQTGSQQGWPIEKAKETMRHCLQNLNPGDTFQLIGFNTDIFPCFSAPVPNRPENVQKALKFLEPLQGSGGTDILKSVDYALKLPNDPDRLRIICYMTDGYVGNDMQIIDYVRKYRGRARMFPFGVGNSTNRFLIEGMAREGRGVSEYVTLDAPGENAAARFYKRVANPLLMDIQVDWNGLPVADVLPQHIPDVFSAAPIIVKGRYTRAAEGDITVRGILRGKPWRKTYHVVFPAVQQEGEALATLWAREKIEDLQQQDWLGAQTGKTDPKITEQIIATALEYRLMSQYTSFVAVEERVINIGGKQRKVDVPVEMPQGVSYEGIFGEEEAGKAMSGRAARSTLMVLRRRSPASPGMVGGIGGGGLGGAMPRQKASAAAPLSAESKVSLESLADNEIVGLAEGKPDALKALSKMKPAERRAALMAAKLAPALHGLAAKVKKEGVNGSLNKPGLPKVEKGRVEVQIWLNSLPPDGLQKLKTLGFDLAATLQPNKLLLGTIAVDKLDALLELAFIRRVEPPRFK